MSRKEISCSLDCKIIGKQVICFESLASTMDVVREEAGKGAVEGFTVIAFEQTSGRGRLGRGWITANGGIAVSILLYPPQKALNQLVMLGALGVLASMEDAGIRGAGIKWPNDIVIDGKKVAGILVETKINQESAQSILGIGVNVNNDLSGLNSMNMPPANIAGVLGRKIEMDAYIKNLLQNLDRLYCRLKRGQSLYQSWKRRLVTLGKEVCMESYGEKTQGVAIDVDRSGNLLLKLDTGQVRAFPAGDVSLR